MNAERIIYYLLTNDIDLTAKVPVNRVYGGVISQGTSLPAVAYNLISTNETTATGLTKVKDRSRVQVTIASKNYAECKEVVSLVRDACANKQGTYNDVYCDSVLMDNVGADFRDDEAGIFYSTIDFFITHN